MRKKIHTKPRRHEEVYFRMPRRVKRERFDVAALLCCAYARATRGYFLGRRVVSRDNVLIKASLASLGIRRSTAAPLHRNARALVNVPSEFHPSSSYAHQ